jgi:hypothetical protein
MTDGQGYKKANSRHLSQTLIVLPPREVMTVLLQLRTELSHRFELGSVAGRTVGLINLRYCKAIQCGIRRFRFLILSVYRREEPTYSSKLLLSLAEVSNLKLETGCLAVTVKRLWRQDILL